MEDENQKNAELAEQFFRHDARNKRNVIDGYLELIEDASDSSTIHRYARQIRSARNEIEEMADEAEEMVEASGLSEVNLRRCIQESLDKLHTSMEYQDRSVSVDWSAEDYQANLAPTVEKMLYNLFDNSIEHGDDDVEIEVMDYRDGLRLEVYDGGDVEDWNDIFPEDGEELEDYPSTGAYLIDRVAENNGITIESSENKSYTVKIPR